MIPQNKGTQGFQRTLIGEIESLDYQKLVFEPLHLFSKLWYKYKYF
jgi:hypothetical protein